VNHFQHSSGSHDSRAGARESQFDFAAVGAFEFCTDCAFEWQPAPVTERRTNEPNLSPATGTDETVGKLRAVLAAKLTHLRVNECESSVEQGFYARRDYIHAGGFVGVFFKNRGSTSSIAMSIPHASQPSINLLEPNNQMLASVVCFVNAP
jgi:hypothetical protein